MLLLKNLGGCVATELNKLEREVQKLQPQADCADVNELEDSMAAMGAVTAKLQLVCGDLAPKAKRARLMAEGAMVEGKEVPAQDKLAIAGAIEGKEVPAQETPAIEEATPALEAGTGQQNPGLANAPSAASAPGAVDGDDDDDDDVVIGH